MYFFDTRIIKKRNNLASVSYIEIRTKESRKDGGGQGNGQ